MTVIKTGSQTAMLRGLELLRSYGIYARRSRTGDKTDGCAFAIIVNDSSLDRAVRILHSAGIKADAAGGIRT